MKAKIIEKKEIAKGTYLFAFQLSENIGFKSGQFFFLTLNDLPYQDLRGNKRHFTILNSPTEQNVIKMATRIRESGFKKWLIEIPMGTEVEVGPISGDFVLPQDPNLPLVFIAGGIGITPFISMLSYIQAKKLSYKIILIYSNRDKASAPFFNELENISKENQNLKLIFTMTQDDSWRGEKRKIDKNLINDYTKDLNNHIFLVSGPPVFVESISVALDELRVGKDKIKLENFSGY